VACSQASPSWCANYNGSWGNGTAANGWDGFNGSPNGPIPNSGWSFQNSHFSMVSSPSISGSAFKATVDSAASTSGQAGQRSLIQTWPSDVPSDGKTAGYQGSDEWYRTSMYFPADFSPEPNTSWNFVSEWHNWPDGPCCAYLSLSVVTNSEDGGSADPNGRLSLRILGGGGPGNGIDQIAGQNANADPTPAGYRKTWVRGPSLQRGHWYDLLFHVKWDYTSAGHVDWFLDGRQMVSYDGPTLYYYADNNSNYSGAQAGPGQAYFMQGYYRWGLRNGATDTQPDSVYLDEAMRGPTRASVGG
jgi:hypothetical protein